MAVLTATKVTQPKEIFSTLFHPINRYPVDKRLQNKPRYPLYSDLSGGEHYPPFEQLVTDRYDK